MEGTLMEACWWDDQQLVNFGEHQCISYRDLYDAKDMEKRRLSGCLVTEEGCSSLASALRSSPSHLKELDLTYNHPGESGVKLLSARLEDPQCSLDTLSSESDSETEEDETELEPPSKRRREPREPLTSQPQDQPIRQDQPQDQPIRQDQPQDQPISSPLQDHPNSMWRNMDVKKCLEHAGKIRIKPGLRKNACDLTLDPNTAHTRLSLSEGNRKNIMQKRS
ncbi:hypothetical protein P4O66_000127 [Electrophorus voltai]|uniref:Uncharacterized protein n=1 Tax=Electrophorus voltai TaxID=2609070 RepID=A0AAD8ZWF9_9TELE|nr:hypothetical protein P4O66_000127 [Electrophorus voltai]